MRVQTILFRLALTPFSVLVVAACGAAPADDAASDGASNSAPNSEAGTSPAARGPARPLPDGAVMLQRVNIIDPGVIAMRGVMDVSAVFYMTSLMNPMGGPPLTSLSASTQGTFAATAPEGQLNLELVEASRRSILPNAAWLAQLFALQNRLGGIAVQGTRERAAIIVAGGAAATKANPIESFQIASGANRSGASGELYPGEASSDRMQRASIEAIRGVDTYLDPVSNSPVQLDHTYDNAWRVSNQDAYILTTDPNFNPGQYGIEANRMQLVK